MLSAALLLASSAAAPSRGRAEVAEGIDHLVVGNPTPMRGDFFTEMWGNATSDIDVRDLLHGYDLVRWDENGARFTENPTVVIDSTVSDNGDGDRTYTFTLNDELCYSDGSAVNAWDYAFSFLFCMAPELKELGAEPLRAGQFAGYQAYIDGEGPLSGIRVEDDFTLSLTLSHEYLPFFYEMGLLSCNPYPISVIAPGAEVRDDGDGVYLAALNDGADPLDPEVLRETVMDPDTGYRSHPSVVSGPYMLVSFDGTTAEFQINPYFIGNDRSEVPLIPTVTCTLASNDTMIDELADGEFTVLNKVTRADAVAAGKALAEQGLLAEAEYPRSGLCYIGFACERPGVSSEAVRRAIACCMDRDRVTADYAGDLGERVDGFYGIGQWMYGVAAGEMWDGISLEGITPWTLDTEKAEAYLDEDGWTINEDGLREKDGTLLELRLYYPEGNSVARSLESNLVDYLLSIGVSLTLEAVPMGDLLSQWYGQTERKADMYYLATNFDAIYDPAVHFGHDGTWSYTGLADEELFDAALSMRATPTGDNEAYMKSWIRFQERFSQILPAIPIYSNYYCDFYSPQLQNYPIGENATWSRAVIGAWLEGE